MTLQIENPPLCMAAFQGHNRGNSMKWSSIARRRSRPHVQRKLYHLFMGLLCFVLYGWVLSRDVALFLLGVVGGVLVLFDILRLTIPQMNRFALRFVGRIMRREELKSISGNSFYILGLVAIVYFFSKPIVLLSVLFLAVGDPAAALVGTHYGKHKILGGQKSAEGAAANWVVSTLAAALFGHFYLGLSPERTAVLALIGGAVSVVVELVPFPLDDNFTIPFFSAGVLYCLNLGFPLF